jgi:hypothetical protein
MLSPYKPGVRCAVGLMRLPPFGRAGRWLALGYKPAACLRHPIDAVTRDLRRKFRRSLRKARRRLTWGPAIRAILTDQPRQHKFRRTKLLKARAAHRQCTLPLLPPIPLVTF